MAELFTDRIALLRELQTHSQKESVLATSPVDTVVPLLGAGVGQTFRVQLQNGIAGIWKPLAGVDERDALAYGHGGEEKLMHECAASHLAKYLGHPWCDLVAPAAYREITVGGEVQKGVLVLDVAGGEHHWDRPLLPVPDQCLAAAMFDSLSGQQDRSAGKFLWTETGQRLWLINQGYAFARDGDILNMSTFVGWRHDRGAARLTGEELRALRHLRAHGGLQLVAELLEPSRAACLIERCTRMLDTGQLLDERDFGKPAMPARQSKLGADAEQAIRRDRRYGADAQGEHVARPQSAREALRHAAQKSQKESLRHAAPKESPATRRR